MESTITLALSLTDHLNRLNYLTEYQQFRDRTAIDYRRFLGTDTDTLLAHCGALRVVGARYFRDRTFEAVEAGGVPSAVIEVLDLDGISTVDLVAWPLGRPEKFASALKHADALGLAQVEDPGSFIGGQPLLVHRTPENWLLAGCRGVVILNVASAPRWLSGALGSIGCEDLEHAREIGRLLHPLFPARRIMAPIQNARAA